MNKRAVYLYKSAIFSLLFMKKDIHPEYYPDATVTCACGNTFTVGATIKAINVELCSNCHPFYTGTQKIVDTAGRIEKFNRRYDGTKGTAKKVQRPADWPRRKRGLLVLGGDGDAHGEVFIGGEGELQGGRGGGDLGDPGVGPGDHLLDAVTDDGVDEHDAGADVGGGGDVDVDADLRVGSAVEGDFGEGDRTAGDVDRRGGGGRSRARLPGGVGGSRVRKA